LNLAARNEGSAENKVGAKINASPKKHASFRGDPFSESIEVLLHCLLK